MLQALLNDNEYLKTKPDKSAEGFLSKKQLNDIAINVLVEWYHAHVHPTPRLSDDQIESIRKLTHKEYADATNEERMKLMNKLMKENEEYSKSQTDEAKKSMYKNNIIMDYLISELKIDMITVDDNINGKKEDSISEEDSISDENSIRDSPIGEFKFFTENDVENVKSELKNQYMSKAYVSILDDSLNLRDINNKL
jgi:hypothetical protein